MPADCWRCLDPAKTKNFHQKQRCEVEWLTKEARQTMSINWCFARDTNLAGIGSAHNKHPLALVIRQHECLT